MRVFVCDDLPEGGDAVDWIQARVPGWDGYSPDERIARLGVQLRAILEEAIARDGLRLGDIARVELRTFEHGTFLSDVRKGNFQMTVLQLPEPSEPDMLRWMFL